MEGKTPLQSSPPLDVMFLQDLRSELAFNPGQITQKLLEGVMKCFNPHSGHEHHGNKDSRIQESISIVWNNAHMVQRSQTASITVTKAMVGSGTPVLCSKGMEEGTRLRDAASRNSCPIVGSGQPQPQNLTATLTRKCKIPMRTPNIAVLFVHSERLRQYYGAPAGDSPLTHSSPQRK